jgi:ankyrin repeat protein
MAVAELFAAIKAGDLNRVEALLAADPSMAAARHDGMSAVLTAVYWQQPAALQAILAHNPPLSFYEAAATGATEPLDAALRESPDLLDAYAPDGFTALGLSSFFGHAEVAALLLARGADPNRASDNAMGVAPLHSAAAGSHLTIAQMLLDRGADPGAVQDDGFTALHSAAQNGDQPLAELLLAHGADPDARTDEHKRPRDLALESGHGDLAEIL